MENLIYLLDIADDSDKHIAQLVNYGTVINGGFDSYNFILISNQNQVYVRKFLIKSSFINSFCIYEKYH